jgi:hypothetical protein
MQPRRRVAPRPTTLRPAAWRRRGTNRPAADAPRHSRRRPTAGAGGDGFGRQRCQPGARRRRRRAPVPPPGRRSRRTTADPVAPGDPRSGSGRTPLGHEFARSGRQPRSALGPAGLEDRSTGPRGHAVAEPVTLRAPPIVGLVGALHPCLLAGKPQRAAHPDSARWDPQRRRTRRAQQAAPGQPIRLGAIPGLGQGIISLPRRARIITQIARAARKFPSARHCGVHSPRCYVRLLPQIRSGRQADAGQFDRATSTVVHSVWMALWIPRSFDTDGVAGGRGGVSVERGGAAAQGPGF